VSDELDRSTTTCPGASGIQFSEQDRSGGVGRLRLQERGLYFLGEKDPKYVDLVSMTDSFKDNPGEKLGAMAEASTAGKLDLSRSSDCGVNCGRDRRAYQCWLT